MKIKKRIPKRLIKISKSFSKRKGEQEKLFRLYAIILNKNKDELKKNKRRNNPKPDHQIYVHLSAEYFKKVLCRRYYKYINFLKENSFVFVKGYVLDDFISGVGIFESSKRVESYCVGECGKGYRILEFPEKDDPKIEIEFEYKLSIPAIKNINFLKSIGVEKPIVKSDNYGFRLYHNLSSNYRKILNDDEFIYYDIKSSIPHQVRLLVEKRTKSIGQKSDPFLDLFNGGDFYMNYNEVNKLGLSDRNEVKKHFSSIIYGGEHQYIINQRKSIRSKFPLFYSILKNDITKKITRSETKLIMDLISRINVDEILTLHDGFIIRKKYKHFVETELNKLKDGIEFRPKKIVQ